MPVMNALRLAEQTGAVVKNLRVANALLGQAVEIGRRDFLGPIATQVRTEIFGDQPEDIRPIGGLDICRE